MVQLGLILAVACSGPNGGADSAVGPDDSAPETEPVYPEALSFTLRGGFGYDPVNNTTTSYYADTHDELPIMPWLQLEIRLAGSDGESVCNASFQQEGDGVGPADWATEPVRFGFDYNPRELLGGDTCRDLDPELWQQSVTEAVQAGIWGLGVSAERPDLEALELKIVAEQGQDEWDEHWVDSVVGGVVASSGFEGPWSGGWAIGLAVDENFVLLEDEERPPGGGGHGVFLSSDEILAGPTLPVGVYIVDGSTEFDIEGLRSR